MLLTVTTREPATGSNRFSSRPVFEDRLQRVAEQGRALLASDEPGEGAVDDAEETFLGILQDLLRTAQKAGTARPDIGAAEVKALLVGCQAMQSYNGELAERTVNVVMDALRSL